MKTSIMILTTLCLATRLTCASNTNGISLTLYFPNTEMLADEWFDYSITLSNGSAHAVQIMEDPRSMINCQFIFDLGTEKKYRSGYFEFDDGWGKQRAFGRSRKNAVPLPAGESYTWNVLYGYSRLNGAVDLFGVTNMSVRCLLGTDQWVRSNTVELSFYPSGEETVVYEPAGDKTAGSTEGFDPRLYKIAVGNAFYLFNSLRQRICELPDGELPSVRHDAEKNRLVISSQKGKRELLYDLRTAQIIQDQDAE